MKKLGFTLAEVLITLAIIGVVAAMAIPSVIVNTNQQQFKTGLKKAVSVLNSAIQMNLALDSDTPYNNDDLFAFLQNHMSVIRSTSKPDFATSNATFYTTDGMRFEFPNASKNFPIHESNASIQFNSSIANGTYNFGGTSTSNVKVPGKCGDYLASGTIPTGNAHPCMILVDVNGDKKPNPANIDATNNTYIYPGPKDNLLKDVFTIMITDKAAIPYGVVAQKTMYSAIKD